MTLVSLSLDDCCGSMSAGQTIATCATSAIPRLDSLFRLCTAYFVEFDKIND